MTGVGMAIEAVLQVIFPLFGIEVPEGSISATIKSIVEVAGFVFMVVGQLRRKDLKNGLVRK